MSFLFFSDPGHGWLKIPRKLLQQLGIEQKITHYSYQRSEYVYLEEDCDASLFLQTMKEKGIEVKIVDRRQDNKSSPIRSYASFVPEIEHGRV